MRHFLTASSPLLFTSFLAIGATWCPACQDEQPKLIADVSEDPSFCVLGILQEGPVQDKTATRGDVDDWTQHFAENFWVVQGNAATNKLLDGYGSVIGLPFN